MTFPGDLADRPAGVAPSPVARDLRSALLAAGGSAVAGLLVGLVWRWVTPLESFQKEGGAGVPVGAAETAVAADGWFAVCSGVAGILAAVAAVVLLRRGRLGALVGLVAGGLLGAAVAWRTGLLLSPPPVSESLATVPAGERFDGPLRLSAIGVLLAWPTTAVISFFAIVAGLDVDHDERPVAPVEDLPAAGVSQDDRWTPPAHR